MTEVVTEELANELMTAMVRNWNSQNYWPVSSESPKLVTGAVNDRDAKSLTVMTL